MNAPEKAFAGLLPMLSGKSWRQVMKKQIEVFDKDDFRPDTWDELIKPTIEIFKAFYTDDNYIKFTKKNIKSIKVEVEYE